MQDIKETANLILLVNFSTEWVLVYQMTPKEKALLQED